MTSRADLTSIDAAVARGALDEAAVLIEQALPGSGGDPTLYLKLAGLRRAQRQPQRALEAVHGALALAPLNFIALALRAALLERLDPAAAGQAWFEALAQRPAGALPPGMDGALSTGEALRDAWQVQRGDQFRQATKQAMVAADADLAWKIDRFVSNVLRTTKVWHSQPTHYHYPGLTEREFHPRAHFAWLDELEARTPQIRAEMQAAMASGRSELVPYIEYQDHEALAQWRALNRNPDWTAIHLIKQGQLNAANAAACPVTMALLAKIPQPVIPGASPNAMFSLLAPQTVIPPHVGINNGRLVCHLPLIVPQGCWLRVGGDTRNWRAGEAIVFDDTVEHEASNPSDQLRVVLIFDVWHPDLTPIECSAIADLIAADTGGVR